MANKLTFEEAISKLEKITNELSQGNSTLEEELKLYEQGVALAALCNKYLDEAEQKVTKLVQSPDGEMTQEEFTPLDKG